MSTRQLVVNALEILRERGVSDKELLEQLVYNYFSSAEAYEALADYADEQDINIGQNDDDYEEEEEEEEEEEAEEEVDYSEIIEETFPVFENVKYLEDGIYEAYDSENLEWVQLKIEGNALWFSLDHVEFTKVAELEL